MNTFKKLGLTSLVLASVANPLSAAAFEGFFAGLLLGSDATLLTDERINDMKLSSSGMGVGLTLGYSFNFDGFILAPDFAFIMPFGKTKGPQNMEFKHKSSMALGLRLGMSIKDVAFPFIRLGYAMDSAEINATNEKITHSHAGFQYGAGIDVKITPELSVGVEGVATMKSKKEKNGAEAERSFSRFSVRVLYNF